jgi:hypothetical protein
VRLEASTKPHVHRKVENFGTNIASTMACPNFKNGPKTALRPLGVKISPQVGACCQPLSMQQILPKTAQNCQNLPKSAQRQLA